MAQKRWSTGVMGLGVLLLLLPFVGEQDSQAFVRKTTSDGKPVHWAAFEAKMTLALGCPKGGLCWDELAARAAAEWNEVGANFRFHVTPLPAGAKKPDPCDTQDGSNTIGWGRSKRCLGNNAALAYRRTDTKTGEVWESDIVFDSGQNWSYFRGADRLSVHDFYRVALHELGHALGLGHSDVSRAVVQRWSARRDDVNSVQPDDIAGIKAIYGGIEVSEQGLELGVGETGEYQVRLTSKPAGPVRVTPVSSNPEAVVVSGGGEFNAENWETWQPVTMEGRAGGREASVRHVVEGYKWDVWVPPVRVVVQQGIEVTPRQVTVGEGATAQYEVRLTVQPAGPVTVTPGSGDASRATVSGALTFDATNWRTPQAVTVTGVDDGVAQGTRTVQVTHTVVGYPAGAAAVQVEVRDKAVGGEAGVVEVSAVAGTVTAGGEAEYQIRLTRAPAGPVTVTPGSGDANLVTVSGAVTFTARNWQTWQAVRVTGVDVGQAVELPQEVPLTHQVTGSEGVAVAGPVLPVTLHAAEGGGEAITLPFPGGQTVDLRVTPRALEFSEAWPLYYRLWPTSRPPGVVSIRRVNLTPDVVGLVQRTLRIKPDSWQAGDYYTLWLKAGQDAIAQGSRVGRVVHRVSLDGWTLIGLRVQATVTDDDTAGVVVSKEEVAVAEGATAQYEVRLTVQPAGPVTVTPGSGDASRATVSGALTFDATNWRTPQAVTVTGVDDGVAQGTRTVQVTHTVVGYPAGAAAVQVEVRDKAVGGEAGVVEVSAVAGTVTAGGEAEYQIRLTRAPAGPVTVTPGSGDANLVTVSGAVTFTARNWQTWQAVRVTGVDVGQAVELPQEVPLTHQVTGSEGVAVAGPVLPVTLHAAEGGGEAITLPFPGGQTVDLRVTPREVELAEGSMKYYRLWPTSEPPGVVSIRRVNLTPDVVGLVYQRTLRIKPDSWQAGDYYTLRLKAGQDAIAQGSRVGRVVHRVSLDGWTLIGLRVQATVTDDDTAGVVVSKEEVAVAEGATAQYEVRLTSEPAGPVTVTPGSGDASRATVSGALTFDATNWRTPQAVTVTGVDDGVAQGTRTVQVTHTVVGYPAGAAAVQVEVRDKAVGGEAGVVEVSAVAGTVTAGGEAEYQIRLTRAPAGPVTVTPGSGDANLVTVSGAVTFTARNWQTWQAVRVTGVDVGQAVELPQEVPLTHQVTGSEGVAVAGPVLPVTLHAAEGGGEAITLPFPGGQTVDLRVTPREVELAEGSMKYYRLWPTSEPPGVVSIRRVNLTPDVVGLVYQRTLRIKPDSWQAGDYYTLRLKAGQDAIAQGSRVGRVVHRVSLDGWTLIGLRVQATVTDDDTAGVVVSKEEVAVAEGATAQYEVRLTSEPAGPVTVTPGSGDASRATVSGALTFDATNWRTPQAVTVTGVDDGVAQGTRTVRVTHTVVGYGAGVPAAAVDVTVTDNEQARGDEQAGVDDGARGDEQAGVAMSRQKISRREGKPARYKVWLTRQPAGVVTVTPVSSAPAVATVSGPLTFTATNWQTKQRVTVTSVNDRVAQGARTVTVTHTVSGYGAGVEAPAVDVTVTDNDRAGVAVTPAVVAVAEGATAQYEVRLTSEPAGPVTVTPGSGDASRATVSGALTFDATNWRTPQAVTVTGVDDGVAQGTRTVRVTHTVVGYGAGVPAAAVTVTVQDNDRAALPVVVPAGGGARKGDWAYCTVDRPCGVGAGDCDHDGECQPGLTCVDNTGPQQYGLSPQIDVCVPPPVGDWAYCTVDRPCGVGAGDCDHDGECQPGLTCVDNTGPQQYGLSPQIDVCVTAQNP